MKNNDNIIKLDILNEETLIEKYNEDKVSTDLINYLIQELSLKKNKKDIKILINNKCNTKKDCKKMIKDGLKREYDRSLKEHHFYDTEQVIFFLIGVTILFLAGTITKNEIISTILVIVAWVPIWKMVEIELFEDSQGRRKRKLIKKLLNYEVKYNNE